MTFAAAMARVETGATVRRDEWGPRRAVRLDMVPWDAAGGSGLMLVDLAGKLPPTFFNVRGEDVAASDWSEINEA